MTISEGVTAQNLRDGDANPRAARSASSRHFRVPKTAELLSDDIRGKIIRGDLQPGAVLESEARMIDTYNASRATVREALRILEAEQLISITRGPRGGPIVRQPTTEVVGRQVGFVLQAQGATISDLYLVRAAIEPYAVWLLATGDAKAHALALRAALSEAARLQARGDEVELRRALAQFHQLIVALTGSNALGVVTAVFHDLIERHQVAIATLQGSGDECLGLKSFWRLINLIEAGRAEEAQAHWRAHIRKAKNDWLLDVGDAPLRDLVG